MEIITAFIILLTILGQNGLIDHKQKKVMEKLEDFQVYKKKTEAAKKENLKALIAYKQIGKYGEFSDSNFYQLFDLF